jgi:hypothetical protein
MAKEKKPVIRGRKSTNRTPKFRTGINTDLTSYDLSRTNTKLTELYLKASKESKQDLEKTKQQQIENIKLIETEISRLKNLNEISKQHFKEKKKLIKEEQQLKEKNKSIKEEKKELEEKNKLIKEEKEDLEEKNKLIKEEKEELEKILKINEDLIEQEKEKLETKQQSLEAIDEELKILKEIADEKKKQNANIDKLYSRISSGLSETLKVEEKISEAKQRQEKINKTYEDLVVKKGMHDKETLTVLSKVYEFEEDLTHMEADNIQTIQKRGFLEYRSVDLSRQKYELEHMIADLSKKTNTDEIAAQKKSLNIIKKKIEAMEKEDELNSKARSIGEFGEERIRNQGSKVTGMLNKIPGGGFINKYFDIEGRYNKKAKDVGEKMSGAYAKGGGGVKGLASSFGALNSSMGIMTKALMGFGAIVGVITALAGILIKLFLHSDKIENNIQAALDLGTKDSRYGTKGEYESRQRTLMTTYNGVTIDNVIQSTANLRETMDGFRLDIKNGNAETQRLFDLNVGLQSRIGLTGEEVNALHGATKLLNVPMDKLVYSTMIIGDKIIGAKNALKEVAKVSKAVLLSFKGTTNQLIMAVTKAKMLGTSLDKMRAAGDTTLDIESSLEAEMENRVITGENTPMDLIRYYAMTEDIVNLQDTIMSSLGSLDNWKGLTKFGRSSKAKMMGLEEDEITNMLTRQEQLDDLGVNASEYSRLMKMSEDELRQEKINQPRLTELLDNMIKDRDTRTAEQILADTMDNLITVIQDVLSPAIDLLKEAVDKLAKAINTFASVFTLSGQLFPNTEWLKKNGDVDKNGKVKDHGFGVTKADSTYNSNTPPGKGWFSKWSAPFVDERTKHWEGMINDHNASVRAKKKYASGIVGLNGPGSGLSDSISARLSKGESVMTSSATRKNSEFFEFANAGGNIKDMIVNTITAYKKSAIVNALSNSGYSNSNNSNVSSNSSIPKTSQNVDSSMDKVVNLLQQILSVASQPAMVKLGDTFVQEMDSRIQLRAGMRANIDGTWGRTV